LKKEDICGAAHLTSQGDLGDTLSRRGEPREVQFVIERDCPVSVAVHSPGKLRLIGLCIWVKWPPEEPWDKRKWNCTSRRFRVTDASRAEVLRLAGLVPPADAYVCEHMGRVIE